MVVRNQRLRKKGALRPVVNRSVERLSVLIRTVLAVESLIQSNGAIGCRGYICCAWLGRRRLPSAASVLASNLAKHAYGSVTEHLPDAFHGREIPVKFALETSVVGPSRLPAFVPSAVLDLSRAVALIDEFPSGASLQSNAFGVLTSGHETKNLDGFVMSAAGSAIYPWPLLRNRDLQSQRAIRLVVHGRSGGEVPQVLTALVDELQQHRSAPVQLEVLTADAPPTCPEQSSWLVPLLLWPGAHARDDVPGIRRRMRLEGADVTLLPFLGAWSCWWSLVAKALEPLLTTELVLLHHPLRPGVAERFLQQLSKRLAVPLLPSDQWADYLMAHPKAQAFPLALAPNRMTEALSEAGSMQPLLHHPLIRQGLIDLLIALP